MKLQNIFPVLISSLFCFSGPILSEENDKKGLYNTLSVGGGRVTDIDFGYLGTLGFETGLELETGLGYDFGNSRIELTYGWNGSDFENTSTSSKYVDILMQTISFNGYFDLENDSDLTPFIGAGFGTTFVETGDDDDQVNSYSIYAGLSYLISKNVDIDLKFTHRRLGDVELEGFKISDVSVNSGLLGLRFHF